MDSKYDGGLWIRKLNYKFKLINSRQMTAIKQAINVWFKPYLWNNKQHNLLTKCYYVIYEDITILILQLRIKRGHLTAKYLSQK